MEGTFAVWASMFAAILSPSTLMTGAGGPMKAMPFSFKALGSFGFSDAWPQPGQTASTPARSIKIKKETTPGIVSWTRVEGTARDAASAPRAS